MVRSREHGLTLLVALGFGVLLLGGPVARWVEGLELGLYDLRMSAWETRADLRIRVLGLDESLPSGGWGRETATRLLGLLSAGGARGVYLMDPPLEGWNSLDGALRAFPVAAVRLSDGEAPAGAIPTGCRYEPELDGAVRRISLAAPAPGPPQPGPALLMVAALEGVAPSAIRFGPGQVQVGARTFPTDEEYRVWIHFQEKALSQEESSTSPFYPLPVARFLVPGSPLLDKLEGAAVLVGNSATEARDEVMTAGGKLRSVALEADVLDTLLGGHLLHRPGRPARLALTAAVALLLAWTLPLFRIGKQVLLASGVALAWGVLGLGAFGRGLWLDLAAPWLACVLIPTASVSLQFARSTRLLGQFLAPDLARDILRNAEAARLGGQEKVCTVMFFSLPPCLKGNLWEPGARLERRNAFTALAAELIEARGGRVMDFQGDAQMVLFGAPRELPAHAAVATATALEILERGARLLEEWGVEDPAGRAMHAGVCTGPLAIGFVGSEQHKEFAALGDTTNVAARLYAAAMKMGVPVLVAGSTLDAAGGALVADPLPPLALKGKTEPVRVFQAREVRP